MSETENVDLSEIKFGELEVSEIERHLKDAIPSDVLSHLEGENSDVNQRIFGEIISMSQDNPLWASTPAQGVIDSLTDKFEDRVITGKVARLLYIGGVDTFEANHELARYQRASFLSLDQDNEPVEIKYFDKAEPSDVPTFRVWGRYPGWSEDDEFSPGNIYNIEIDIKNTEYDGEQRTFYNLQSYQLEEEAYGLLKDTLLDDQSFNVILEEAVGDRGFSEALVELINDEAQWQDAIVEFQFSKVRPRKVTKRVLKETEKGKVWVNKRTEQDASITQTSDTGIDSLSMTMSGNATLGDGQELVFYLNFYPQRMGQLFIASPTMNEVLNNPDFISATPEQQADFLNMMLSGKVFRSFGQITNLSGSDDETTLTISQKSIAIVEVEE